jgi:hypothetical protein
MLSPLSAIFTLISLFAVSNHIAPTSAFAAEAPL